MVVDKSFNVLNDSGWFRFSNRPVEFCTSLHETGSELEFIYSISDNTNRLMRIPFDSLFKQ